MKKYKSNDEFFQDFQDLVQRIDENGNNEVAEHLRHGFACLNGLTDGWGMLMDSIEETISQHQDAIPKEDMKELKAMLKGVKKVVYRR